MNAYVKNTRMFVSMVFALFLTFCTNLYAAKPFVKLPDGQTRYLTETEPALMVETKNGEMTDLKTLDLNKEIDVIVSFTGEPLCLRKNTAKLKSIEVRSEHEAFKAELTRLTGIFNSKMSKTQSAAGDYHIKHEYYQAFNGVSMTCKRGLVDLIKTLPMVKNVYTNRQVKVNLDFSVHQIRADKVLQVLGYDGKGVLVGIVDTGIDYMHPALGEGFGPGFRVIGGYDFANDDADPVDDHGHGTHVAGIVGASSDSLTGVAPGVHFLAIKVLDANGSGWSDDVIAGLEYCLDPDGDPGTDDAVDIMNFSLGGAPEIDDPLEIAINNASDAGILSVISAGNSGLEVPWDGGFESISSPGTAEKALTVGACDTAFALAFFSSKGPDPVHYNIKPEVVAPGFMINSSVLDGKTERHSGTSMAAPHVAGVAALLKEQHPEWTAQQLKAAIVNSAVPLPEEYNPYHQGTGCVDAWNAAHQEILVQPGTFNFGMVDLAMDVWRDTLTFTVRNTGTSLRSIRFERDDDLPADIQINTSTASMRLGPGEERSVTVEIVVPASVPAVNVEPYAYYDDFLFISGPDTVKVPFGVTKANLLVLDYDMEPWFYILWRPNSFSYKYFNGREGQQRYHVNYSEGNYNILTAFVQAEILNDSTFEYTNHFVERQNVEIGGLTYQTISHEEADIDVFQGPVYDMNNQLVTDEGLVAKECHFNLFYQDGHSYSHSIYVRDNVYTTPLDSSLEIAPFRAWGPENDLLALNYTRKGFNVKEDLIPPSGPDNLTSLNVHYAELNENMINPGLEQVRDSQSIGWYMKYYPHNAMSSSSINGLSMDSKLTDGKLSVLRMPSTFDLLRHKSIEINMTRENMSYSVADLRPDEDGKIHLFERPTDRISDQIITRYVFDNGDTLNINPGEEIFFPAVSDIMCPFGPNLVSLDSFARLSALEMISPCGVFEQLWSKIQRNQPEVFYYYYDKAHASLMDYNGMRFYANIKNHGYRYSFQGSTVNYYLQGQNGHTAVKWDFYLPVGEKPHTGSPMVDQLIVLSDGKPATWLRPSGSDNKIRLCLFDYKHDIDDIHCYLIPSAGEKIELDLDIDEFNREVMATVPDSLPHEFIDFQVTVRDTCENQMIFTSAPAFFYGNSLDERVYDSRVFMYKYNLENVDQFPFTAGDTLTFTMGFTNNGNVTADDIIVKFPETSMFKSVDYDGLFINNIAVGDSTALTVRLQVLDKGERDTHYTYSPEIHWQSGDKSYKRSYAMFIKTWEVEETGVDDGMDTSTPLTYQLFSNYPNPFNPSTTIAFQLPRQEKVTLEVYNMLGQRVRTLTDQIFEAGNHKVVWDGRNETNAPISSGVYFVRMTAGEFVKNNKMVLLK